METIKLYFFRRRKVKINKSGSFHESIFAIKHANCPELEPYGLDIPTIKVFEVWATLKGGSLEYDYSWRVQRHLPKSVYTECTPAEILTSEYPEARKIIQLFLKDEHRFREKHFLPPILQIDARISSKWKKV